MHAGPQFPGLPGGSSVPARRGSRRRSISANSGEGQNSALWPAGEGRERPRPISGGARIIRCLVSIVEDEACNVVSAQAADALGPSLVSSLLPSAVAAVGVGVLHVGSWAPVASLMPLVLLSAGPVVVGSGVLAALALLST